MSFFEMQVEGVRHLQQTDALQHPPLEAGEPQATLAQ